MDSNCLKLLPSVCEILADSKFLLHDDATLEKLLDCFKEPMMQNDEQYVTQCLPHLLQFFQSVISSQTVDPSILSFSLRLAGLLAGKEHSFTLLKERGLLEKLFQPDGCHMLELWSNSSVRHGWLQGLWNMIHHQQSINFFCTNGFMKLVLQLQNDKGLFITSLSNQLVAHILNSITPGVLSNTTRTETPNCQAVSTDCISVTEEVISHVTASLASQERLVVVTALRLSSTILCDCTDPLKIMFWNRVVGPLEVLANTKDDSFTQPIIAVLQSVVRSPALTQPDSRVETLMDIMLFSRSAAESVRCATVILQMENCPEALKWKATDVILLPLLCATSSSFQLHEPDKLKGHISHVNKQLSEKALCVCLLTQSLSSVAEHLNKKSLADVPVRLIASSVIKLLKICLGHCPFTLPDAGTLHHLIGCSKVQRCSVDVLSSLTVYAECTDVIPEALNVLLQYLQSPESHATVLKRTYLSTLKWLGICSPSSDSWKVVIHQLFQLTRKHVCDIRWEVRDSTLEFITQLTANLKGNSEYTETLHSSGVMSMLFASLSDLESYVQASAVAALGEAVTTSGVCNSVQEKAVGHLLNLLSEDTQAFPRRAALRVITAWLRSPHCCTALEQSISSVLLLGGNDVDWEVKTHTLEFANVLMDKWFSHCPCHFPKMRRSSGSTCVMQALSSLNEVGVFEFLFKCLFDCDRPVSLKACSLLLKLRTLTRDITTADHPCDIGKYSWIKEMFHGYQTKQETGHLIWVENGDETFNKQADADDSLDRCPQETDLFQILELLDLEKMHHSLSLSSDHVISSPRSLMEDILFMTGRSDEHGADCY